jgi:hypothetical protein
MNLPSRFTSNDQLEARIRRLLWRLSMVSEAQGTSISVFGSSGREKDETKPPRGVREDATVAQLGQPNRAFLLDAYLEEFVVATSDASLRMTCVRAEIDLGDRQRLPEHEHEQTVEEREAEQIRLVLDKGEGIHAAELAAEEGWPIGWVKTVRERNGKEPTFGRPRPRWRELEDDQRRVIVANLKAEGFTQRAAAQELGIGNGSVAKYWPADRPRLRAA